MRTGPAIIPRLDVYQLQPGLYELRVSEGSDELFVDEGFSSIEEALRSGTATTGPIKGFEVAYEGLVVGTYLADELRASIARVANQAVALYAAFSD